MAAGVEPSKGRAAAKIISEALAASKPKVTVVEAAGRARITPDGWLKVIRTERGYERTFLAMARAVGVEAEVREALGIDDLGELDPFERSILGSGLTAVQQRQIIDIWRSPGGREWLESLAQDRTGLARQA
jgi:hypothetical protein